MESSGAMRTTRDDLTSDLDLDLEVSDGDDDEEFRVESISATFGSSTRSGFWPVPSQLRAKALFGEVKIDFRGADLPDCGIVDVHATAVFGAVKLIVPTGSEVHLDGRAAFGEFSHKNGWPRVRAFFRNLLTGEDEPPDPEPDPELSPIFHVTGSATFGEVSVTSR